MKFPSRPKFLRLLWLAFGGLLGVILLIFLIVALFARIPSFEELEKPNNKLATQIISCDGQVLSTFHIENRSYVTYDELSPSLVQAVVATEDARFYTHSGIDFPSLGRVAFKTVLGGDSSQGGGSTITQQLAKTLYPRQEHPSRLKLIWTKFREWFTAVKLERNYTKDEIVTMYFNSVFFGSNAYGIQAASRTFFDKDPVNLTAEESATLVGMVNAPTRYNPNLHPDNSTRRRNFVLGQMAVAGYLTEAERDSLRELPMVIHYQMRDHNSGLGPYFRDMLRRTMNAREPRRKDYRQEEDYRVDSLQWACDGLYGWLEKNRKADGSKYDLDRDGLRIYTTIDSRMQRYAEEAVREHLAGNLQPNFFKELRYKSNRPFAVDVEKKTSEQLMKQARRWSDRYRCMKAAGASESEIEASFRVKTKMRVFSYNKKGYCDTLLTPDDSIRYYKSFLRCAFMAVEPVTGHIKAYVGGPDYRYFKYDNVRQGKRQVGSTIKPFLYTLAMQEGMSPCTRVANVPQSFVVPGDVVWTPRSTDKDEWIGKMVTLKWGLAKSSNNISAYLMKQLGPEAMVGMMRKMGVGSFLMPTPSLCVGSADLNVFEMVSAYNTFPSRGVYVSPMFVTRITDSMGNTLGEFTSRSQDALSEQTAFLMANLMQGVVNSGTGYRLRSQYKFTGQIAGKTGTTNNNSDGWFIGYIPRLTAGVWVGGEDQQIHFESLALGSGGNMSLPIWGNFMRRVYGDASLGYSQEDVFTEPMGMQLQLDCTGGDMDMGEGAEQTVRREEENFFD